MVSPLSGGKYGYYMKIWEVMNTLRQDIMEEFSGLEQEY